MYLLCTRSSVRLEFYKGNQHSQERMTQRSWKKWTNTKSHHNCKSKGGKEKKLKEKACHCWQHRMGVFEDKQTKATVGGKKQVTEELLNITEVAAHEFFHQKAKLMMRVNWI